MYKLSCLILLLVACQSTTDTTPPNIASSTPSNASVGVVSSAKLAIVFSEAMKQDSVTVTSSPSITLSSAVWNDAKTVVFDPTGGWQPSTTYIIAVEGKDLAGNALSGTKTISFQTVVPPDTTPPATPTGVKATPGENEFFVAWNANTESDLAGYTVFVGDTANALLPMVFAEKSAIVAKVSGLDNGKTYFYALEAQDTSGNRSAKSATALVTPKDSTAPTLVSSEPASGTQDITLVPTLRFVFSEPMNTGIEIGFCITDDAPASATCPNPSLGNFGTPSWSEGDTVAQFSPPNPFQSGKTHVLVVLAKDKGGNELTGQNKVTFALRATPDTTAPTVTNRNIQISDPTAKITLSFSEPMNQQSVQGALLSQPPISCTWSWQGNSATCSTGALEQLTTHTITLGTAAKDTAGNALAAPYQFTFPTDNFAPRVTKFTPTGGKIGVIGIPVTSPIVVTFSEPMDQALTQSAFEVKVGGNLVAGTFEWDATGTTMTYRPGKSYGFGSTVTWTVTTKALEASAGPGQIIRLHLAADFSRSFTTELIFK